jgi:hypothetical protein
MPPTLPHRETPSWPASQTSTFHEIANTPPRLTPTCTGTPGMAMGPTSACHGTVDVLRAALTLRGKRGLPRQTPTRRGKQAS